MGFAGLPKVIQEQERNTNLFANRLIFHGGKTPTKGVFRNVSGHHELKQIVRTAGLGTHAGHLEPSKGVSAS